MLLKRLAFIHQIIIGFGILRGIFARVFLEEGEHVLEEHIIKVFTAQLMVAARGYHVDGSIVDAHDGDIEGTTAKVVDKHTLTTLL